MNEQPDHNVPGGALMAPVPELSEDLQAAARAFRAMGWDVEPRWAVSTVDFGPLKGGVNPPSMTYETELLVSRPDGTYSGVRTAAQALRLLAYEIEKSKISAQTQTADQAGRPIPIRAGSRPAGEGRTRG